MKQILCFGDSNTYGLIPGGQGRFGWGIRWSSILDEHVRKKGYRVIEEGLCGRTTVFDDTYRAGRRGTELLPVLLETHSPVDIVILMLGTNDCKAVYGATPERIGEGVEELVGQIQRFDSEIQIVLVSPIALGAGLCDSLPPNEAERRLTAYAGFGGIPYETEYNRRSIEVSQKLPAVYRELAEKRGLEFLAASDYANPSSVDMEHMDAENHRFFAEAISRKIEGMIVGELTKNCDTLFSYGERVS